MGAAGEPLQDGVIKYASGNTAVVVSPALAGQVLTIYSDHTKSPTVLVMFNSSGVGCVSYKNGKPWLVVTLEGWSVSDRKGSMIEKGKGTRTGQEIRCEPTPYVLVTFRDRQNISVTYDSNDGVRQTWNCGEHLRRSESHLDKVLSCNSNGKLNLDVDAIRARQASVGSVYVSRGPQSYTTEHTGLGSLKKALATVRPGGEVHGAVQQLQAQDSRIKLINTLPCPLYGTSRQKDTSSIAGGSGRLPDLASTSGSLGATDQGATTHRTISSPLLPDYGTPPLSSKQRRWQKSSQSYGKPVAYQPTRIKLEHMSMSSIQLQILGKDAVRDTLYCVCLLADWNPGCGRLLPKLEEGWCAIQANAAADPAGGSKHIKVLHVDASEGRWLQQQYSFRSVPMFLMFYAGRLVYADNNISTKDELVGACTRALEQGQKGEFLPDTFSFGQQDNNLLSSITPHMTLRA